MALMTAGCASVQTQRAEGRASAAAAVERLAAEPLSDHPGFSDPAADRGPLPLGIKKFALEPGSAVAEFGGGRVRYMRFALPEFEAPYFVEIMAYRDQQGLGTMGTIPSLLMWSAVSLLDADFAVIATLMPRYQFDDSRYSWLADDFGFVNICDQRARYLVVHGVPALYGKAGLARFTNYTMYGNFNYALIDTQSTDGSFRVGIPSKPIGERLFGLGEALEPCTIPDTKLEEFLRVLEAHQSGEN